MAILRALLWFGILAFSCAEYGSLKTCKISPVSRKPCDFRTKMIEEGECRRAKCCYDRRDRSLPCYKPGDVTSVAFSASQSPPHGFYGYYQTLLRYGGEPGYLGSSLLKQCFPFLPKIPCPLRSTYFARYQSPRGMCNRVGCCFDERTHRCLKGKYRILRLRPSCSPGFANPPACDETFCDSSPCENAISCTNEDDGFSCQCQPGYTGERCETVDNCDPNPCCYEGVCTNQLNGFTCQCVGTYSGDRCQEDSRWGMDGYTALNGYSYKLTTTSQNFEDSRTVCENMGGQLAYIGMRDQAVFMEILPQLGALELFAWIDLSTNGMDRVFRWRDGLLDSQGFTSWGPSMPDNLSSGEDCVITPLLGFSFGGFWDDRKCSEQHRAICERLICG